MSPEEEIRNFLHNDLSYELNGKTFPLGFFHYTKVDSLRAILETSTIRAGCLERVNDASEARFAVSVFRAFVDRRYAIEGDPERLRLLRSIRHHLDQPLDLSFVFVLSFSSDGDEKGMWSLYADRGEGFSFCIPTHEVIAWAGFKAKGWLWQCRYGEDEVNQSCTRILDKFIELYQTRVRCGEKIDIDKYAASFVDGASYLAPIFKPKIWHDEKEWRWIFVRPEDKGKPYIELPLAGMKERACP